MSWDDGRSNERRNLARMLQPSRSVSGADLFAPKRKSKRERDMDKLMLWHYWQSQVPEKVKNPPKLPSIKAPKLLNRRIVFPK